MTFVRPRARILEISTTSGGGPLALAGAADGSYNAFASFMAVGDQTYVTVAEPGVAFWTGIATYSATNQLTLTTVEETKGTFGAGTKEVMASPLASTSMFREDIAGAIVTGGTSTAYTVASYRKYGSLAALDGNIIAFTPHVTNGLSPTLSVDGLGAGALCVSPDVFAPSGTIVQGTPYTVTYNAAKQQFYLHGVFGAPYQIPLGASLDFWGSTAPSSAFALAYGQAISRSIYSALFALFGVTYGVGDGSTTFNIPDLRGRVVAGKDDMGGSAASRLTGATMSSGTVLGGVSSYPETKSLVTANVPPYTPAGTNGTVTVTSVRTDINIGGAAVQAGGGTDGPATTQQIISTGPGPVFTGAPQGGTSTPFSIVQPTIIANKLLRII